MFACKPSRPPKIFFFGGGAPQCGINGLGELEQHENPVVGLGDDKDAVDRTEGAFFQDSDTGKVSDGFAGDSGAWSHCQRSRAQTGMKVFWGEGVW